MCDVDSPTEQACKGASCSCSVSSLNQHQPLRVLGDSYNTDAFVGSRVTTGTWELAKLGCVWPLSSDNGQPGVG